VLRTSQATARTGGAKEDFTPDARLMDLSYKVYCNIIPGLSWAAQIYPLEHLNWSDYE